MTVFRHATQAELDMVLDWAAAEGWNPGLDDAAAFYQSDPDGFFVAEQEGQCVAAISVVNHSDRFAFLGLYIVLPGMRGQGVGLALWQHALAHAGGRTVGLDGVEAQQDNYRRSGFEWAGATTRFTGVVRGMPHKGVRRALPEDIEALAQWEATASGAEKPAYLRAWLTGSAHRVTLIDTSGAQAAGFCTVRKCRSGAKIGPLSAKDADSAARLIRHAATQFPGPVSIDVPASSPALTELCQDLGLVAGFRTARMYRGPDVPQGTENGLFAVTSLELG